MTPETLGWLIEVNHLLKIQKGNIRGSRDTLFAEKTADWIEGYTDGYHMIIEQFDEIIKRSEAAGIEAVYDSNHSDDEV